MEITHNDIKKAIIKSQHCQRNWDLTKVIPDDDLELLIQAVTECPSKQNLAHYKVHFITNRNIIEEIHNNTEGFARNYTDEEITYETNSQTLANLLVVFEAYDFRKKLYTDLVVRNDETQKILNNQELSPVDKEVLKRDQQVAVGIAAGYLNLLSSILGYSTGCCSCFSPEPIQNILNTKNEILLLMGIGFKNDEMNRRIHQKTGFIFPTKKKQQIEVSVLK
jgi:nitroreductase